MSTPNASIHPIEAKRAVIYLRVSTAAQAKTKPKGQPRTADTGVYRWHIYGFEKQLPKDWRFLNWDRVVSASLLALAVVLAALLVLAAIR